MTIASRTPEGFPVRCPICGTASRVERSEPVGDAPCPACGYLLMWLRGRFDEGRAETSLIDELAADPRLIDELEADSIDVVEFVMGMEEHLDISVPDHEYERIRMIGDAVRCFRQLLEVPPTEP